MHKPALLILFFLLVLHYIYMPREVYAQTASKSASVSANGNTLGLFEDIFAALSSILSKHPINKDLNRDNDGFLPAGLLADNFTLPSSSSASNRVAGTEDTNAVADTAYQYSVARSVSIPEETSSSKQTFFQKIFSFFQDLFGGIIETGNESATQYASRQVPAGVAEIHMNETAKGNMPANDISSLPILGEAADNMAMAKALDFSRCANLPPGPDFCEGGWVGGVEKTEPTPTATPTPANFLPPENEESGSCPSDDQQITVPNSKFQPLVEELGCITPKRIVIHWSGSWNDVQVTFDTLTQNGFSCQLAIDDKTQLQMLHMYKPDNIQNSQRGECIGGQNHDTINMEISGFNFDEVLTDPNRFRDQYEMLIAETNKAIETTCWLLNQYRIPKTEIYGHYQFSTQKSDPGVNYLSYFKQRIMSECN